MKIMSFVFDLPLARTIFFLLFKDGEGLGKNNSGIKDPISAVGSNGTEENRAGLGTKRIMPILDATNVVQAGDSYKDAVKKLVQIFFQCKVLLLFLFHSLGFCFFLYYYFALFVLELTKLQ